jgi:hypothetical protein
LHVITAFLVTVVRMEQRRHLGRIDAERAPPLEDAEVEARRRRRHLRDARLALRADREDRAEHRACVDVGAIGLMVIGQVT